MSSQKKKAAKRRRAVNAALAKERADVADGSASPGQTAAPKVPPFARVARPIAQPDQVALDASELLKVYEPERLGANSAPLPAPCILSSLVPADVLNELHARGEIDLFDEAGNLIEPPKPTEDEVQAVEDFEEIEEIADSEVELVEESAPAGADSGSPHHPERVVDALNSLPLFSHLGREALLEPSRAAKLRTVEDRRLVFREGDEADSFFILAEGSVELVQTTRSGRELALRHFGQGEVFGLFGVFAGRKRAASVRAIGQVSVLEVPAVALAGMVCEHPAAKSALETFYKERLVETFLASSPIFEDLDAIARGLLIGQFRDKKLAPGETAVAPGEVFNGLFLVISGGLEVKKRLGGGTEQSLATLGCGQFFGVVSALSGSPCRCSVAASEATSLTCLTQKAFNDFVKDYPALRLLPQRLAQEGMLVEKDIFVGDLGIPGLG
ncbi:MAG: cyclic nucleotide-binding domain-containing protein [Myxococcales bacterium]|jgi:CRP-like cAMP-binding protein